MFVVLRVLRRTIKKRPAACGIIGLKDAVLNESSANGNLDVSDDLRIARFQDADPALVDGGD
jgi:hypothetical protein